jgi:hypothetical protein
MAEINKFGNLKKTKNQWDTVSCVFEKRYARMINL